jgi:molybdopterin molybdotransferase
MVSVEEADKIIQSNLIKPEIVEVKLEDSIGHILAEKAYADRDFPPFNRVTMDGLAIQFETYESGSKNFPIENVQAAGSPQKKLVNANNGIEVMTGAMLPEGCDTVIRYEDFTIENNVAQLSNVPIEKNQNIHPKGQDIHSGDLLATEGIKISPAEIALLASVGKSSVKIFNFPMAAIISTGDELVEVDETPLEWQVRRSNVYALQASLKELNIDSTLFHLKDDMNNVTEKLIEVLKSHTFIILSGGVSKGKFDFIPSALEKVGIRKLFHQVTQRPGKPFWFGRNEHQVIFALPGNPVSTYLCFYRYIKPWIVASTGVQSNKSFARLASDFKFTPQLTYFLQVKITNDVSILKAEPDAGGGSGDFVNLKDVDGFLELPIDRSEFKAGEVFPYYPFRT